MLATSLLYANYDPQVEQAHGNSLRLPITQIQSAFTKVFPAFSEKINETKYLSHVIFSLTSE